MTTVNDSIKRAETWLKGPARERWAPAKADELYAQRYPVARAGREALKPFREWLVAEGAGERTARNYVQSIWASLISTGGNPMADFSDPRYSRSTKLVLRAAWSRYAEWTDDAELERELSSRRLKRTIADKKNTHATRAKPGFSVNIVDQFLAEIDTDFDDQDYPWAWPVLRMMLILGLRAGVDVTWITREAVATALRHGTLTITSKGDKVRTLPREPVLLELRRLLEIPNWEVLSELIAPQSRDEVTQHQTAYGYIANALKAYAERIGIDPSEVKTHRFRRAAALRVYAETRDIVLVQQMLGHANVTTTQRYLEDDRTDEIGEAISRAYAPREVFHER
jgi:integrase